MLEGYCEKTDEELIKALRQGETNVTDFLMEKYKNLVRKRANAMFLLGGEPEDLIQEGMIGLFKAIRDYREEKESSFVHFADICVTRQIIHAVEAAGRKKHLPLNSYVSFDAEDQESGLPILDALMAMEGTDPEQMVIHRENVSALYTAIHKKLSKMERQVLAYYLQGLSYRQIAEEMDKTPKTIDNALSRIKNKLNQERQTVL